MADKHEVTFEGQMFELRTGAMSPLALAQFVDAVSDDDPNAMIPARIVLRLLRASILKKDWRRFEDLCDESEDPDGLINRAWDQIVVPRMNGPVEAEAGHPTGLPSVSTDGPEAMPRKSVSGSDARVIELSHGRPDRYAMLLEAREEAERRRQSA